MHRKLIALGVASLLAVVFMANAAGASVGGFKPITAAGHAQQTDTGSCNNDWANVSLDKTYKLTSTATTGVYNLEVKESGPLAGIEGVSSPGACVSGTDNGTLVGAGVTGFTHQEFNAAVSSSAAPNPKPNCAANSNCTSSTNFLDAVFGAGNWTRADFSWTAHYEAGSHGTYFDTSVNWPLDNRGDIS